MCCGFVLFFVHVFGFWQNGDQLTSHFKVVSSLGKCIYVQFSSVAQLFPTLCNPMDCSMPGFPVMEGKLLEGASSLKGSKLLELAQPHIYQVGDAIQPSHPMLSPSSAFNLSHHQYLFQ